MTADVVAEWCAHIWTYGTCMVRIWCYERPKNVLFISSAMMLNYEPGGEPAKAKR
jgi:hypothetical protein